MRQFVRASRTLVVFMAALCACAPPPQRVERTRQPRAATAPPAEPARVLPTDLYTADEGLRDVLSGELEYLGTGRWPGIERSRACAFRNDRVLIVNVYCTRTETPAFRVDVYSPTRGRVRIYAEANGPVSTRARSDYFTFMVEGGLPPDADAPVDHLALNMNYQELSHYEEQRYRAYLPGCYAGQRHYQTVSGCMGTLASRQDEWTSRNQSFVQSANDDWYRVIRELRALATRYGRDPVE